MPNELESIWTYFYRYGRKKGIVKKQGAYNKMNQSCQAVSEEIRETTKKAKEAEEAAKASDNKTKVHI